MAQIAYLIHAHNEPELCLRLINKLQSDQSLFFVHWDRKNYDSSSLVRSYAEVNPNVFFYSEHSIHWMGITQIEGTLFLMKKALEYTKEFKYLVLLSGQDYPIKPKEYLLDFFNNHTTDFIWLNRLVDMGDEFLDKVKYHHFMDVPLWNPKSNKRHPLAIKIYYGVYLKRIARWFPKRRFFKNWTPYFGSNWFVLRANTCTSILQFVNENPKYMKFMKTVEAPDEIFFHTIIGNTDLINNVSEIDEYRQYINEHPTNPKYYYKKGSLRYMDWESPDRAKPAILDMRDYDKLLSSQFLFCRKVSMADPKSLELLEQIDTYN